jgi:hypothetical protein
VVVQRDVRARVHGEAVHEPRPEWAVVETRPLLHDRAGVEVESITLTGGGPPTAPPDAAITAWFIRVS